MVKCRLNARSSLCDLFKLLTDMENRVIEKTFLENKQERRLIVNHPLMHELYVNYSRWAFEKMLYEYMMSHPLVVK